MFQRSENSTIDVALRLRIPNFLAGRYSGPLSFYPPLAGFFLADRFTL